MFLDPSKVAWFGRQIGCEKAISSAFEGPAYETGFVRRRARVDAGRARRTLEIAVLRRVAAVGL